MASKASPPEIAIPGKLLGSANFYLSGRGTHIHEDNVIASQVGRVVVTAPKQPAGPPKRMNKITRGLATSSSKETLPTISVSRSAVATDADEGGGRRGRVMKQEVLPDVGNLVLCRVTRLMPRQAIVSIQQVGDSVLDTEWQGVIRQQDVRATEKDKVKMYDSFKPGDLVRAQVISLGDQSNYYLSTSSNELGVIMAVSEAGNDMVPVSWKEFKDPITGSCEARKVAKPE